MKTTLFFHASGQVLLDKSDLKSPSFQEVLGLRPHFSFYRDPA
jgi:hypothetical protein